MDPDRPEPSWVTLGRFLGWVLLEWAGMAFVVSLIILVWAKKGFTIQGLPGIHVVAAAGSLAGVGLLLILFLGEKRAT